MPLRKKTGGRKKGSLNKATADLRDLAANHGPAAIKELARLSKEAKSESARLSAIGMLMDRAYGRALPGRHIQIDLPDTSSVDGVTKAIGIVVSSAATGDITPGEASELCGVLEAQRRAVELSDIETRLSRLEGEREHGEGKPA